MSTEETAETGPDSFEAIEKAVMESRRGRWFLDEYVKRRSGGDATAVLAAIAKLESAAASNHELIAERLGRALNLTTATDPKLSPPSAKAAPELRPEHMKFFKQDEELFEPSAKPRVVAVVPDVQKGAKLVIKRQPEPSGETAPVEPAAEAANVVRPAPAVEALPKSRIVIVRHKAGQTPDVPLHDELRASA